MSDSDFFDIVFGVILAVIMVLATLAINYKMEIDDLKNELAIAKYKLSIVQSIDKIKQGN